jgi:hypothetical protein
MIPPRFGLPLNLPRAMSCDYREGTIVFPLEAWLS